MIVASQVRANLETAPYPARVFYEYLLSIAVTNVCVDCFLATPLRMSNGQDILEIMRNVLRHTHYPSGYSSHRLRFHAVADCACFIENDRGGVRGRCFRIDIFRRVC